MCRDVHEKFQVGSRMIVSLVNRLCVMRVFVWRYVSAYMGFGVVYLLRFVSRLYNRHFQTLSHKPREPLPLFEVRRAAYGAQWIHRRCLRNFRRIEPDELGAEWRRATLRFFPRPFWELCKLGRPIMKLG